MNYKCIFFDLDGTLTDSGEGIFDALAHVFKKYNIDDSNIDYREFIGPPLKYTIQKYLSEDSHIVDEALEEFRSYYKANGLLKGNKVYEGIEKTLEYLYSKGFILAVVTSKLDESANMVLEHFNLKKYFKQIFGPTIFGEDADKYDILLQALRENKCESSNAVMIGDRKYDMYAAQRANVHAVGALYGYGSRKELESYPHIFMAQHPLDIKYYFEKFFE